MHVRPWLLATLTATVLTACDDPSDDGNDSADDGATTKDDGGTDTADEAGTASTSGTSDGADGESGGSTDATDAGDSDTASTGDPADGYPADVLDHLELPWPPYDYDPELPEHWQTPGVGELDNMPAANPTTDAGATLGRVLFFDTVLSANETIACATCHAQADGFSDPDQFSTGFEGGLTGAL